MLKIFTLFSLLRQLRSTAVTTAIIVLAQAGSLAQAQAPNWTKIRVGVEANYPPFSKMGTDGKVSGFDIDIAHALCTEMKAQCSLVTQEWDGMMPALQARKFDMIVASMTISDERRRSKSVV